MAQKSKTLHVSTIKRNADPVAEYPRPRCRRDCENVPRPCPYVGCRYSMFLDVTAIGSLVLMFGDADPTNMPARYSCVLDIAERGELTLESIGEIWYMTKERIRQIEGVALRKLAITIRSQND